ncbi:hypothetical protein FVB43_20950 [Erwinia rhapontici]|uniref:hypothetical protein n=1 Tax=Erwinia rhapontici TaxID=55212 RepID=UPI0014385DA1|nr:hypothetical protein [Erwinia rhapontici]NKG32504.1 hypothetical protein [Erwinia rhapontici]
MPAGLQCWDANGKLIVDIGDYNLLLFSTTSVTFPQNGTVITVPYSGVTAEGFFAAIVAPGDWANNYYVESLVTRTYNGGFRVINTAGDMSRVVLNINIYRFI